MGKNILIFDDSVEGHHLEYLHHIYEIALEKTNFNFVFSVPSNFILLKDKFTWPPSENIYWDFICDNDIAKKSKSKFLHSFRISNILRSKVKQYSINYVFLISLMGYLPFLPLFFLNLKVRISGIIYMIYLFRWKNVSFSVKAQDVFKYIILSKLNLFGDIFILNSPSASRHLCHLYNCSKFIFLPDPFINIPTLKSQTICINENKRIFLHFGSMSERKGTLDILKSILLMSTSELIEVQFVFAGKINEDIKAEFYFIYNYLKFKADIILLDRFCYYEEIIFLCQKSECILIPYKETAQSSGVIAYAAQFMKPVIAPEEGLIGKLVKHYHLGVLIKKVTPQYIHDALFEKLSSFRKIDICFKKYISDTSIMKFKEIIANKWESS